MTLMSSALTSLSQETQTEDLERGDQATVEADSGNISIANLTEISTSLWIVDREIDHVYTCHTNSQLGCSH